MYLLNIRNILMIVNNSKVRKALQKEMNVRIKNRICRRQIYL